MTSVLETLSNDLATTVERVGRSVVAIHARRRIPASGILWRDDLVVAAQHTIQREEDIGITLADGTTTQAVLVGRDPGTDLAALRIPRPSAAAVTARPADAIRAGTLVLALGRPGKELTATLGLVSAVGEAWRTWHGGRIDRLIRLDIGVYDGFSGGPLVDVAGAVLGINTSGLLRGSPTTIPAATVNRVLDQLLEHGRVPTGYLGVAMQNVRLPKPLTRALDLTTSTGLMIVGVEPDSPADRAGILLGDVLLAVDGTAVSDPAELLSHLDGSRVDTPANLRVLRAGKAMTVSVTVGERPKGRTK